jgi:hypothetical protein
MHGTASPLWLYISRKSSFVYIWVIVSMYSLTERWRRMVAASDKAKPDIGNIKGLNLAVVKLMTVQVTKLPL